MQSKEMIVTSRPSWRRGAVVVAASLALAACSRSAPAGHTTKALWDSPNGSTYADHSDTDSLDHNIVVSLAKTPDGPTACTGVLVSPLLVLTAASCKLEGKAGATPFVQIGATRPFKQVVAASRFVTFASDPSSEPSLTGQDLALVVLKDFVFENARAKHPPLQPVAPTQLGSSGDNRSIVAWIPPIDDGPPTQTAIVADTFSGLVLAGWSSLNAGGAPMPWAADHRQVLQPDTIQMYRYATVSAEKAPFLVIEPFTGEGIPKFGLAAGDNGAPLLVVDGTRWNVIGIASIIGDPPDPAVRGQDLPALPQCAAISDGAASACDAWVDVTADTQRNWILANVRDTTRTDKWRHAHPPLSTSGRDGERWIGDVDYAGPCDPANDSDCDHVLTKNPDGTPRDNCPTIFNPDQTDSPDAGEGDACNFTNCGSDTSSDANNCGACGHHCIGGACVNGMCNGASGTSYPPAAVWISSGGGSVSSTDLQLNLSLCPGIVGGTAVGSSNSVLTFNFFSYDIN